MILPAHNADLIQSHDPSERQRTASNPLVSAWVNASAGSGKTKVLTDRMLRLLLPRDNGEDGTAPERILALTFTKAGANEMALRLSRRLAEWAVLDDTALSTSMEKNLLGRTPTEKELIEARKLFAKVVDAPGGLKILTIHSFCQSVLGRFPIEAGLVPDFDVLEDSDARELLSKAMRYVLTKAAREKATPLSDAVHTLAGHMNEEQITGLVFAMNAERQQLMTFLEENFGVSGLYTKLCTFLKIDPGQDIVKIRDQFFNTSAELDLHSLCTALAASNSAQDVFKGQTIARYWETVEGRQDSYAAYRTVFLTKEEGNIRKSIVTKTALLGNPALSEQLFAEAQRLLTFEANCKSYVTAILSRDAMLFSQEVLGEYQNLKNAQGALDFNDLILRTRDLLNGQTRGIQWHDATAWVLYKLDEGIEHILVDEAQDTNPEQWEIIQLLSEEFFAGLNANERTRTVFVVGDEKQSIFSFQRAAPDKFRDMFNWFEKKVRSADQIFTPVPINTSFRSIQIILNIVDKVFANPGVQQSLTKEYLNHFAFRSGQAGLVELWPIFHPVDNTDETDETGKEAVWDIPITIKEARSGAQIMATKIGDTIKNWLDRGEILGSYDRPIEAGDILILVKSRNAFVPQLVRALKLRNIPVSGVDRMILSEQLVVEDLCAAARFALLPDDDLTLATFLKSPFIGYDEDRLYKVSQGREKDETLWKRLKKLGDGAVINYLSHLIELAGASHPYEFFGHLVQSPCPANPIAGLHAIKQRLGEDAVDPLDEFLNLCLNFEHKHTPSLQSFLQWHEKGKSEIKRQLDEGGGAVRIMTVHGSKGLQAPIVFLPDTVRTSTSPKGERILWPHKTGLPFPIVSASKADAPDMVLNATQSVQDKEDEEYKRLLYVAMTRAEERLYIGGYTGKRRPSEDGNTSYWYEDIKQAFSNMPNVKKITSGIPDDAGQDQPILRVETERTAAPDKAKVLSKAAHSASLELPDYFRLSPAAEPFPPRPLVPSRPSEAEPAAASPLNVGDTYRFLRGNITHKLLQILPELGPAERKTAADKFVAQRGFDLPEDIRIDIVREVMSILENSTFAAIFGLGSMAEVPVTGLLASGRLISGQIDRILIKPDEIFIIDFKTNRPPPLTADAVPDIYKNQMRAYGEALSQIYPGRRIRTALLWTDGPRLMEISAD